MDKNLEHIAKHVVDSAMSIHIKLGPGLLESVYIVLLQKELQDRGFKVEKEVSVPLVYKSIQFDLAFRADLIVDRCFLVELKSVEELAPVHYKQVLTYLKLMDLRLGLLNNFGAAKLKDGIRRVAN